MFYFFSVHCGDPSSDLHRQFIYTLYNTNFVRIPKLVFEAIVNKSGEDKTCRHLLLTAEFFNLYPVRIKSQRSLSIYQICSISTSQSPG